LSRKLTVLILMSSATRRRSRRQAAMRFASEWSRHFGTRCRYLSTPSRLDTQRRPTPRDKDVGAKGDIQKHACRTTWSSTRQCRWKQPARRSPSGFCSFSVIVSFAALRYAAIPIWRTSGSGLIGNGDTQASSRGRMTEYCPLGPRIIGHWISFKPRKATSSCRMRASTPQHCSAGW
jgi:hypothetical protein